MTTYIQTVLVYISENVSLAQISYLGTFESLAKLKIQEIGKFAKCRCAEREGRKYENVSREDAWVHLIGCGRKIATPHQAWRNSKKSNSIFRSEKWVLIACTVPQHQLKAGIHTICSVNEIDPAIRV